VLDEADQMLDMGFEEDMEVILQQVRQQRITHYLQSNLKGGECGSAAVKQLALSSNVCSDLLLAMPWVCFVLLCC
jgi:superfamily II DNA/RNA helicase